MVNSYNGSFRKDTTTNVPPPEDKTVSTLLNPYKNTFFLFLLAGVYRLNSTHCTPSVQ